jgi:ABC-type dipeptide/oligopeptide/nickel transport system permease subunit
MSTGKAGLAAGAALLLALVLADVLGGPLEDALAAMHDAPDVRQTAAWWLHGARRTVAAATLVTVAAFVLGLQAGTAAAFGGALLQGAVARMVEAVGAAPTVVVAGIALHLLPAHRAAAFVSLMAVVGALGVARVVQTRTRVLLTEPFMLAVRGLGAGPWHLARAHVFPHVAGVAAVNALLTVPISIGIEAALIGLELPAPFAVSWVVPLGRPAAMSPVILAAAIFSLSALFAALYCAARALTARPSALGATQRRP